MRATARNLAASRVAAAVRLAPGGTTLILDAEILSAAQTLRRRLQSSGLAFAAPDNGPWTVALASEKHRAMAWTFFRKLVRQMDASVDAAAANLSAPPGHRRLAGILGSGRERATNQAKKAVHRDFDAVVPRVTGHALDVAPADGHTLFAVWTPAGQARYVALGRFFLAADGRLITASGLLALGTNGQRVPEGALAIRINPAGELVTTPQGATAPTDGDGPTLLQVLGRLSLVKFPSPAGLRAEAGMHETVYAETPASGTAKPVSLEAKPLRPGVLLIDRVDPSREGALLAKAEELREVALASLRALARAETLAHRPAPVAPTRRTLTIVGMLPWSAHYLERLQQPITQSQAQGAVLLDVTDRDKAQRNLLSALAGLRLRIKVHGENLHNAGRTKPALYRRRLVVIDEKGAVHAEEDPSEFRKVYAPKHPEADAKGYVLYPNVFVKVEYSELAQAIGEFNLLRLAILRLSPDYIIPEMELPAPSEAEPQAREPQGPATKPGTPKRPPSNGKGANSKTKK